MEKTHRNSSFVRQASILAGASLLVRLMGFLYRLPLTNLIGDEGNAYYAAAYQVYTFAIIMSSGALIAAISRLTSERIAEKRFRDAHQLFKTALIFSTTLGIIATAILYFWAESIAGLFNLPEAVHSIRVLSPAVFLVSILAVFRGYFQGMQNAVPTAVSQVVEQIFKVSFSIWLAYMFFDAAFVEYSAAGAAAGTIISVFSALAVVWIIYRKTNREMLILSYRDSEKKYYEQPLYQVSIILKTALPMIAGLVLVSIANFLDLGMSTSRIYDSGYFTEDEIRVLVGQFQVKFILLTTLPVSLSMALSSAIIPEISAAKANKDIRAIRQKSRMALRLSMALSFPAAAILTVLADPIVLMLFPNHPDGGVLLRFGAVSILLLALTQVSTGILQGVGLVSMPVIAMIFGIIIKVPVNYFLLAIPGVNILGAVFSTIACFLVAGTFNMYFLLRIVGVRPEIDMLFVKPAISAIGMSVICFMVYRLAYIFAGNTLSTLLGIFAGGLAYLFMMILFRGFNPRDIDALPLPRSVKSALRH